MAYRCSGASYHLRGRTCGELDDGAARRGAEAALRRADMVAELADAYTDCIAQADDTAADAAWFPLIDALNLWRTGRTT